MPSPTTSSRKQKAVYWAATGFDSYGEPTLAAKVEVSVRWETGKTEVTATIAVDAVVVVDREMAVGSVLWKGTLVQYAALSETPVLYQVVGYKETPNIKARKTRRVVHLNKLSQEVPGLT